MKAETSTTRRRLVLALSMLVIHLLLLVIAAPALADLPPWAQTGLADPVATQVGKNVVTSTDGGMTEASLQADHELRVSKAGWGNRLDGDADAVTGWIDYTIDYWVPADGTEPAPGVVITDRVPMNTAFLPGSCYPSAICSEDGGLVTWNRGDLAPGDSGIVGFRATVPSPLPDGTIIQNAAHIFDADGVSWQDDADVTVRSDHSLTIGKTGSPDPVDAGALLTYTISYGVPSGDNEPAPNVIIEDAIPPLTSFHSAAGPGAIDHPPIGGTGLVRWHLGTLMPGDSGLAQLVVRVASPLDDGEDIVNSATISDGDGEAVSSPDVQTLVRSSHTLVVEKLDTGYDPVQAGEELVYTIVYTVTGNESSYGATLVDDVPTNTTYAGCSGGALCSHGGNQVTWVLGQLDPNADTQMVTGTAFLALQVNSPLSHETIISNTAGFYDDTALLVTEDEETVVHSAYSYAIEKSAPGAVASGDELVYTIDWAIAGNRPASGVTITDPVPVNTGFLSCSGGGSCGESGGVVTWHLGDPLYPPDSGQVSLRVGVENLLPDGTAIVNTATIQDGVVSLESVPVTTTVDSDHVLSLFKLDDPDPVEAGMVVEYTLGYEVTGNQPAPDVVLRDTIPGNTAFLDCVGCAGPDGSGVISWTLGTLVPPHNDSVSFRVTVTDVLPNGTSISNSASLSDDDGKTAFAGAETTVESSHSFDIEKIGDDSVGAGESIDYLIQFTVLGNERANGVVITDRVPANTTFVDCSGGDGCIHDPVTGVVTWQLGSRAPGSTGSVDLQVRTVAPLDDGTLIENTAHIHDDNDGAVG